jgi:hypothetical protein
MENCIKKEINSRYRCLIDSLKSNLIEPPYSRGLRKRLRNTLASFENSRYVGKGEKSRTLN